MNGLRRGDRGAGHAPGAPPSRPGGGAAPGGVELQSRITDALTGLPNRQAMQQSLDELAARPDAPAASLLLIDLDRFTTINNSHGYDLGDRLLAAVAVRLLSITGFVARVGGDGFAVLCLGVSPAEAERRAERIRLAFTTPFDMDGRPFQAWASIGVAHSEVTDGLATSLLCAADSALHVAKRQGGNRVEVYSARLQQDAVRRMALEQDLHAALRGGGTQFVLHYQPVVTLGPPGGPRGGLRSFEALIRWNHPSRGLVPPGEFIPLAEEIGLIGPLGDWVLEAALRQLRIWWSALPAGTAPPVAVNVSPLQLLRPGFADHVGRLLCAHGVPAEALWLEVTEGTMADMATCAVLAGIRARGVRVAVDDFGTGYSSLSYLHRLPADIVKLDRSFLPEDAAAGGAEQEAFIAAVVQLAHTVGLGVIAEGIETEAQLALLGRVHCDAVQGYLLARPMPEEAANRLLEQPGAWPWQGAMAHAVPAAGPSVAAGPADDRDTLTGAASRRGFDRQAMRVLAGGQGGTLAVLDLDGLDADTPLRRAIRDAVLMGVTDLLTENARRNDVVGRIGDARFAILMPGVVMTLEADAITRRIHAAVAAAAFATPVGAIHAACRIGAACLPAGQAPLPLADLLRQAEPAAREECPAADGIDR